MADVAMHHGYSRSFAPMASPAPTVDMQPTPGFVFPPMEQTSSRRRPVSVNLAASRPRTAEHRRGASALPSFTFNANDASGLTAESETENANQLTPSRGGHKRNTSEFVGGLGLTAAVSNSPTRSAALAIPERPPRHKHTRSRITLSSNELGSVMFPSEPAPRTSTSLPNTPLEHPSHSFGEANVEPSPDSIFGAPLEDAPARPPSRPRVEFSENVEYIPRPLSTISSETESSLSTVRGHSVNNSISSVLSLSTPSPASARARATSLETTLEDEPRSVPKSSLEISKRIEKEGQWLKHGSVGENADHLLPDAAPNSPKLTFADGHESAPRRRISHKKRQSLSQAFGFDRRKSEPTIAVHMDESSRLSALSLQEPAASRSCTDDSTTSDFDVRSSSRKLKDWAVAKLSRKSKDFSRYPGHLEPPSQPDDSDASPISEPAAAETDLDAVFSLDADSNTAPVGAIRPYQLMNLNPPSPSYYNGSSTDADVDDCGTMLDLDAALGPFQTPQLASQRPRRELHSSRGTKDFVGPGGHYLPSSIHRRTESAPMLTPFDQGRIGTPPQPGMADVFEEEEEDCATRPASKQSLQEEEAGMGVQIVDSDLSDNSSTLSLSLDDGLRIQHEDWEPERPTTSYGHLSSRLSAPVLDHRTSSIIEDTIMEETSPIEPAIVEAYEEPRAHSLTKSSDSSETPTVLATPSGMLGIPDGQHFLATPPESYQSSAFSSPDFARRQNSFDTSRVGTSASSLADNRTVSSCTTGDQHGDVRGSAEDVPSLTSSRSTMTSTAHANISRRDVSSVATLPRASGTLDPAVAAQRRRKRASIASLSQLVGGSFRSTTSEDMRPQTATEAAMADAPRKKEHRLKKLMFWKSKHRHASAATIS